MLQLLIGFITAAGIAYSAHRLHSLSISGVYAAALVGTVIFGIGGWRWAILLLTFFTTSSLLTRSFRSRKTGSEEKYSKGGRRDAGQVFGNGLIAALFALLTAVYPATGWTWLGFAASLAAVNADTWATELGILNPSKPRLITNMRRLVEPGSSGGVSLVGTLSAFLASGLIGLLAALLAPSGPQWSLFPLITSAGLLGSLFDSFLGATVQVMYYCPVHQKETEKHPLHTCGTPTRYLRGWRWLHNDIVNFLCSLSGAALAISYVFLS